MQLIYIHGLNSDANSIKGQMLTDWCAIHRPEIQVFRPDLNVPPLQVMQILSEIIARDPDTGLVGSSLGGFFSTVCVAKYGLKAVLVNPATRPFERFQRYFTHGHQGFTTDGGWTITESDLADLAALYQPVPIHPERILVLLKQGDEVLDYRVAEAYYSQDGAQSPMIIEAGGDHFMHDMADKIPLMIDFLFA
ncbi:esterase [Aquirhabdus parva]|uniref:Esterase n=2 Tax=Aquirhabdus parva TaxID=2283318 RepID=A0A345PBU8_9GAMM|nr:esterase [Aquirhabdus parva]